MKKFIYSIAALITLFTACNKADNKVTPEEQGFYITLPVGFQESKTAYDPSSEVKCKWVAGDKVATKAVYEGTTYASTSWMGDTKGVSIDAEGVATISASVSWTGKNKNNKIYAVYPWNGEWTEAAHSNWIRTDSVVKMPSEQHPTASSFDPLADIMTTLEEEVIPTASNYDAKLIFYHRVGFMALSFKDLPSEVANEYVKTVTIKADAPLTANLQICEPAAGTKELVLKKVSGSESNEITLSYTADIKASELVAYACVLPGTYSTLSFELKTKGGKTVTFAERTVNVAIAEGQMIHPVLTYSESKGDTAVVPEPEPEPTSYTLTITPSGTSLAAVTTDTSVTNAVDEFGLAGKCAFTTKFDYVSNSKPIGKQILSFNVVASAPFKYSLSTASTNTGATKHTPSVSGNLSVTNVDNGCCYFALSTFYSGSTVNRCNISKIVITYTK